MYIEDPNALYGCWGCGSIMPEVTDDGEFFKCSVCNTNRIVYLQEALSVMEDLYTVGMLIENDGESDWPDGVPFVISYPQGKTE